jgi:hypothetical protein
MGHATSRTTGRATRRTAGQCCLPSGFLPTFDMVGETYHIVGQTYENVFNIDVTYDMTYDIVGFH